MVSNSQAMRKAWSDYRCILKHEDGRRATILGLFAGVCPPEMLEPFEALSQALTMAGYRDALRVEIPRPCKRGIIQSEPCHSDGTNCSLHNYGVAVDVDPDLNPKLPDGEPGAGWTFSDSPGMTAPFVKRIKLSKVQVDAVLAIRTIAGKPLFLWLGDTGINDTMHFEVRVPPDATAVDWDTIEGGRIDGSLRGMGEAAGAAHEEDDMWQYLTVDEALVRHAFEQGWLKPKTETTLNFFLDAVRSGEINNPEFGDFRNFRVAVTNGIALSAGKSL